MQQDITAEQLIRHYEKRNSQPFPNEEYDQSEAEKPSLKGFSCCDVHILRSVSKWSGFRSTENSILKAYIQMILSAKRFIYIENQFFMSSSNAKVH